MATSYTITGNVRDLIDVSIASAAQLYVTTNLDPTVALVDNTTNKTLFSGATRIPINADGSFVVSLIGTNNTDLNVTTNTLRWVLTAAYKDDRGIPQTWSSGQFALTANTLLKDIVASTVPPVMALDYLAVTDRRVTLEGTGSPEGVVTATVGQRYVDTNATNGAVEWIKASGSGNTGWRVVFGDTGWRAVPALIAAPWADSGTRLRRTEAGVWVNLSVSRTGGGSGVEPVLTMPSGFSVYTDQTGSINSVDKARMSVAGAILPAEPIGGPIRLYGLYATAVGAAWPTSLPGTPA